MKSFAKWQAIKFGWETFKKQPWLLIGIALAVWIIPQLAQSILQIPFGMNPWAMNQTPEISPSQFPWLLLSIVVGIFLGLYLSIGVINVSLKLASGKKVKFGDLFDVKARQFLMFIVAAILYFLVLIPPIALIIFGFTVLPIDNNPILQATLFLLFFIVIIIISIKFQFYSYRIVDKNVNGLQALKDSFRMTSGYELHLFLFMLLVIAVTILGLLALIVGIIVATPVTWIAQAHVYRKLAGEVKK